MGNTLFAPLWPSNGSDVRPNISDPLTTNTPSSGANPSVNTPLSSEYDQVSLPPSPSQPLTQEEIKKDAENVLPRTPQGRARRLRTLLLVIIVAFTLFLLVGLFGFRYFYQLDWTDSFLNSSLMVGGVGLVADANKVSQGGKIFTGIFGVACGILFIGIIGVLISQGIRLLEG